MTDCLKRMMVLALSGSFLFPPMVLAENSAPPGLITASTVSTIVSTRDLGEGGEMWALWIAMNEGNHVDSGQYIGKWAGLSLVLRGSSVSLVNQPQGTCYVFGAALPQDTAGIEITSKPGDGFGCIYSVPAAYWEENRGTEPYEFAQLAVGVGHPDDPHMGPDYEKGGGLARASGFAAKEFSAINDELRAAGAMTLLVRQVTMPPGARMVADDKYPALRLLTQGTLKWGNLPPEADAAAAPKQMFTAFTTSWIQWSAARRTLIANETDKPAQFVEWNVAPASGSAP